MHSDGRDAGADGNRKPAVFQRELDGGKLRGVHGQLREYRGDLRAGGDLQRRLLRPREPAGKCYRVHEAALPGRVERSGVWRLRRQLWTRLGESDRAVFGDVLRRGDQTADAPGVRGRLLRADPGHRAGH